MRLHIMLRHAFLNIFRNVRSTLMILFILTSSTAILFITNCFLEQMYRGMRMGFMYQSGYLQVAAKGFWDPKKEKDLILAPEQMDVIKEVLGKYPEVVRVNQELSFQGIIGTEKKSTIINGMGIEAGKQGGYGGYIFIQQGSNLEKTDEIGVLIGNLVGEKLGVHVGDFVNIMANTIDGSMNIMSAQIMGIVSTGMEQSDAYFTAGNLPFVQELRNIAGVERLLLFLRNEGNVGKLKNQLMDEFKKNGLSVELRTWKDLNKFYFDLKGLYDGIFYFVIAIISLLVFLAVMQIITMAFFERFREIGTIRAIGNTKGEVFMLLLGEAAIYFVISVTLGAIAGMGVATFLNHLDLSWYPPGASRSVPFAFFVRLKFICLPVLVVFFATVFAVLFPALKSSRRQIIDVLNYE